MFIFACFYAVSMEIVNEIERANDTIIANGHKGSDSIN